MVKRDTVNRAALQLASRFVLREKTPRPGTPWSRIDASRLPKQEGLISRSAWRLGWKTVISDLMDAGDPDGLVWVLSASDRGKPPCDRDMLRVRMTFDMVAATEDTDPVSPHAEIKARHLYLPVVR